MMTLQLKYIGVFFLSWWRWPPHVDGWLFDRIDSVESFGRWNFNYIINFACFSIFHSFRHISSFRQQNDNFTEAANITNDVMRNQEIESFENCKKKIKINININFNSKKKTKRWKDAFAQSYVKKVTTMIMRENDKKFESWTLQKKKQSDLLHAQNIFFWCQHLKKNVQLQCTIISNAEFKTSTDYYYWVNQTGFFRLHFIKCITCLMP